MANTQQQVEAEVLKCGCGYEAQSRKALGAHGRGCPLKKTQVAKVIDLSAKLNEMLKPELKQDSGADKALFEEQLATYIRTKDQVAQLTKVMQGVQVPVYEYVKKFGDKTKPGTDDAILVALDHKLQWQAKTSVGWNEEAALEAVKGFEGAIEMVPRVRKDVYAAMKASGQISAEQAKVIEPENITYARMMWELAERKCCACKATVGKKMKFCPECGVAQTKA
jgi:hypothetical protein